MPRLPASFLLLLPSLCKGWVRCCPDSMNNVSPFFGNYCPFCSFLRSLFTSKRCFQGLQAFISVYIFMAILLGRAGELIYFADRMKGAYEGSLYSTGLGGGGGQGAGEESPLRLPLNFLQKLKSRCCCLVWRHSSLCRVGSLAKQPMLRSSAPSHHWSSHEGSNVCREA